MQFSTLLFATAACALALPSLNKRLGSTKPSFDIALLSAGAIPHGSGGIYYFLLSAGPSVTHTTCNASRTTFESLVSVGPRVTCADAAYSWNWTMNDAPDTSSAHENQGKTNGSTIRLWYRVSDDEELYGEHAVPGDQIVWTNQQSPTGTVQVYAGPANLTVEATSNATPCMTM